MNKEEIALQLNRKAMELTILKPVNSSMHSATKEQASEENKQLNNVNSKQIYEFYNDIVENIKIT